MQEDHERIRDLTVHAAQINESARNCNIIFETLRTRITIISNFIKFSNAIILKQKLTMAAILKWTEILINDYCKIFN